jgi:vanillate O-demethylase monooxygenase subunit
MFIRNAWYVAAWNRDLVNQLLPVRILGENIVLYRQTDGTPVALEDACVHRKLPLSMGRLQGDLVECGYHGLRFDGTGRCVHIPCADHIPRTARVRSYPLVVRYGLVWIWMGEAAAANPDHILTVEHWDDPAWQKTVGDTMTVDCHYLYLTDNLLDPSHVAWVHPSSFGAASCEATPVEVAAYDNGIHASRWMYHSEVAPLYRRFVPFDGDCDRLQRYSVRFPCHALVTAIFVPAGVPESAARLNGSAFMMDSYNLLTPVDERQTRYFWFQVHNASATDADASRALAEGVKGAFEEDRVILNAVQRGFATSHSGHISIPIDAAPLRFRRLVKQRIAAETNG